MKKTSHHSQSLSNPWPLFSPSLSLKPNNTISFKPNITKTPHPLSFSKLSLNLKLRSPFLPPPKFSAQDQEEITTVSDDSVNEKTRNEGEDSPSIEDEKQQEVDWKTDEEFKKFMGNPSIEAAIKLEKKRADRKLKELDSEVDGNPIVGFFKRSVRGSLRREKERLEKAEESFKALDLNKLKSCFGYDTFFAVDVGDLAIRGIFIENLSRPIEEVMPKLEKKLTDAAGRERWFFGSWRRRQMTLRSRKKCVCIAQWRRRLLLGFLTLMAGRKETLIIYSSQWP